MNPYQAPIEAELVDDQKAANRPRRRISTRAYIWIVLLLPILAGGLNGLAITAIAEEYDPELLSGVWAGTAAIFAIISYPISAVWLILRYLLNR
jgi:hypothetical protein